MLQLSVHSIQTHSIRTKYPTYVSDTSLDYFLVFQSYVVGTCCSERRCCEKGRDRELPLYPLMFSPSCLPRSRTSRLHRQTTFFLQPLQQWDARSFFDADYWSPSFKPVKHRVLQWLPIERSVESLYLAWNWRFESLVIGDESITLWCCFNDGKLNSSCIFMLNNNLFTLYSRHPISWWTDCLLA